MIVHQVYALISEEKVQNICVCDDYEMANFIARATYGNDAFAVDCLQYACTLGDFYRDGLFYKVNQETSEEVVIEYTPTQEQQVFTLTQEVDATNNELTQTQIALVEQYEENLALQEEVTMTQLALVEIYENMEVK